MHAVRGDQGRVSPLFESLPEINRCFSADSIEEIYERLEEEGSLFAKDCIAKMKRNSPTALDLTLALIRRAERNCYG